jgi:hypothetical protein
MASRTPSCGGLGSWARSPVGLIISARARSQQRSPGAASHRRIDNLWRQREAINGEQAEERQRHGCHDQQHQLVIASPRPAWFPTAIFVSGPSRSLFSGLTHLRHQNGIAPGLTPAIPRLAFTNSRLAVKHKSLVLQSLSSLRFRHFLPLSRPNVTRRAPPAISPARSRRSPVLIPAGAPEPGAENIDAADRDVLPQPLPLLRWPSDRYRGLRPWFLDARLCERWIKKR